MDVKPVYELRERLRAAVIAGANLLSEDFRLRRALEAFKPLETASPVFAKVGQLTAQLLSPDCSCPQLRYWTRSHCSMPLSVLLQQWTQRGRSRRQIYSVWQGIQGV